MKRLLPALVCLTLALKEQLGDKRDIARTLYNMAGIHVEQHNLVESLRLYRQTLELREAIDDKVGVGDSLLGIGLVYDARDNYPLALEFFRRALAIFEQGGGGEDGLLEAW
ncbi:MAG: tetratricopeptide repeat protein [Pyrinomonadaceae bacterium]